MITEDQIHIILKEKTSILSQGIIDAMDVQPYAIYLVGGYGRGEGAWYEDEIGIHPYNDFDLAVITDNPLSFEKTESLRKELSNRVGIKWVDIDFYTPDILKRLKPTIHDIDLVEGHSLIFGEDVIKQNNITLDSRKIGKEDLILLYRTRMWTLLGSWEGGFHDLNIEEARFFKNQMAKAILAAGDMRLVKLKRYTTSYIERAKLISEIFKSDSCICELTQWAITEKTRPSSSVMKQLDMEQLYFSVKEEFLRSFRYAFAPRPEYFLNPDKTKIYYMFHTKTYLYHIYSLIRHGRSTVARSMDVFYAMNYVLHANCKGSLDKKKLNKASKLLLKNGYIQAPSESWDELRLLTAKARNNS